MDSRVPLAPSFTATSPVTFTYFIGMNLSTFHNGMKNYDTQSMPWVSNHFPLDMPNMSSPFPFSPFPTYMNPVFGYGGMMAPLSTYSFDRSHVPQTNLTVGGWNIPSYRSNPRFILPRASAQMGGYSTYYTPYVYPSFVMLVPTNTLHIAGLHMSFGISYRGNNFYGTRYPLQGNPSHGGKTYPQLNNPYHAFFSSQTYSLVMMHVQNSNEETKLYG
jgi:hypothetical protein